MVARAACWRTAGRLVDALPQAFLIVCQTPWGRRAYQVLLPGVHVTVRVVKSNVAVPRGLEN